MMDYDRSDVRQWLLGAFRVFRVKGPEFNFPCPACGHESFYFNLDKLVGFCHRAACHKTFDMNAMIDVIGYPPDLAGYTPMIKEKPEPVIPLALPDGAIPIREADLDRHALYLRGVTWDMIKKFNIHQNHNYIIVPIYEEGKLVQYNSRRVNKNKSIHEWFSAIPPGVRRYKYHSGIALDFFLGWDECKLWDHMVLVENTFVSMWLRDLNCTTNFGSYLSKSHIDKIVHSNIKKVILMWDQGADMQKPQRALRQAGIACEVVRIEGQPDNHKKEVLKELIEAANV